MGLCCGVEPIDKVSRVDLCVDLPGVDVGKFCTLALHGQSVCRATQDDFHRDRGRFTGVTFGRGDIVARIYDKVLEVSTAKPDPEKQRIAFYSWPGEVWRSCSEDRQPDA